MLTQAAIRMRMIDDFTHQSPSSLSSPSIIIVPFNIVKRDHNTQDCAIKHPVGVTDLNDKPPTNSVIVIVS